MKGRNWAERGGCGLDSITDTSCSSLGAFVKGVLLVKLYRMLHVFSRLIAVGLGVDHQQDVSTNYLLCRM